LREEGGGSPVVEERKMRRLFVDSENILDNIIHITDADSVFYLTGVLRLGVGDDLYVSDGTSKAFETRIKTIGKDAIKLEVIKDMPFSEGYKARITLFQGLPKGAKMDEVVRKSTELGVYRIVPTLTKRSVPDISGKNATRLMRWRRIAAEAARQSGRINIP
jgi:16S rRNA (uracil1498-N3)-methyltransferase